MNLKEFRELTKDLPDDMEIVVDDGSLNFFHGVRHTTNFFAVMDLPGVVWLEMTEEVTEDYDMGHRIDAWHDSGRF